MFFAWNDLDWTKDKSESLTSTSFHLKYCCGNISAVQSIAKLLPDKGWAHEIDGLMDQHEILANLQTLGVSPVVTRDGNPITYIHEPWLGFINNVVNHIQSKFPYQPHFGNEDLYVSNLITGVYVIHLMMFMPDLRIQYIYDQHRRHTLYLTLQTLYGPENVDCIDYGATLTTNKAVNDHIHMDYEHIPITGINNV